MTHTDERRQTSRSDHEVEDIPNGFLPRGPNFRRTYQPAPQECEDPEQYCKGGYHPVTIGDTFQGGRFTVIHKLGHGGGATVWLSQDSEEDRYVALKILQARDSSEDVHELKMHRYLQEKLNEIDQRSMIALYEHFWIGGPNGRHLCLVFEVAGPALASFRHWDQWKKIRPDFVRQIALQAVEGLLAFHQADIVLGDLSAGNILFRLADISHFTAADVYETFGHPEPFENRYVADNRPVDEPGAPTYLYEGITFRNRNLNLIQPEIAFIDLAESYVVGTEQLSNLSAYTASYAAPEVLLWKQKQEQASDVWALACILFEMRSGEELFASDYGDLNVQSAYIDHLGALPGPWVTELRKQFDQSSEPEDIEADVQSNATPEPGAIEDDLMEDIPVDDNDQHQSEDEPLVAKPKGNRRSIIRCILLSIIDAIRNTGKHLFDFFHHDNLNPWMDEPDVEMNLGTNIDDEIISEQQISEDLVPLDKSPPEDDVIPPEDEAIPPEDEVIPPEDEVIPPEAMPPSNNVVPPEVMPEGLIQRLYDIGSVNKEWHDMSLDQRLELAQKFYTSMGRHETAADTATLMAEVNTGNAPVGPLSNDEITDFVSLLRSMLQYRRADRASLADVIQHPWFTTPTTDPWEVQGAGLPWIATCHPGTNYVFAEEDDDVPMTSTNIQPTLLHHRRTIAHLSRPSFRPATSPYPRHSI